jgi:hypothetical protein
MGHTTKSKRTWSNYKNSVQNVTINRLQRPRSMSEKFLNEIGSGQLKFNYSVWWMRGPVATWYEHFMAHATALSPCATTATRNQFPSFVLCRNSHTLFVLFELLFVTCLVNINRPVWIPLLPWEEVIQLRTEFQLPVTVTYVVRPS